MVRCGKPIDGLECNRSAGHKGVCDPSVVFWEDYQLQKSVGTQIRIGAAGPFGKATMLDGVKAQLKAIVGTVIAAAGVVGTTTVTEPDGNLNPTNLNIELPNTPTEWITFATVVVATYLGVFGTNNFGSMEATEKAHQVAINRVADGKQTK